MLNITQIAAIIGLLVAFGAPKAQVDKVQAILQAPTTASVVVPQPQPVPETVSVDSDSSYPNLADCRADFRSLKVLDPHEIGLCNKTFGALLKQ